MTGNSGGELSTKTLGECEFVTTYGATMRPRRAQEGEEQARLLRNKRLFPPSLPPFLLQCKHLRTRIPCPPKRATVSNSWSGRQGERRDGPLALGKDEFAAVDAREAVFERHLPLVLDALDLRSSPYSHQSRPAQQRQESEGGGGVQAAHLLVQRQHKVPTTRLALLVVQRKVIVIVVVQIRVDRVFVAQTAVFFVRAGARGFGLGFAAGCGFELFSGFCFLQDNEG